MFACENTCGYMHESTCVCPRLCVHACMRAGPGAEWVLFSLCSLLPHFNFGSETHRAARTGCIRGDQPRPPPPDCRLPPPPSPLQTLGFNSPSWREAGASAPDPPEAGPACCPPCLPRFGPHHPYPTGPLHTLTLGKGFRSSRLVARGGWGEYVAGQDWGPARIRGSSQGWRPGSPGPRPPSSPAPSAMSQRHVQSSAVLGGLGEMLWVLPCPPFTNCWGGGRAGKGCVPKQQPLPRHVQPWGPLALCALKGLFSLRGFLEPHGIGWDWGPFCPRPVTQQEGAQ